MVKFIEKPVELLKNTSTKVKGASLALGATVATFSYSTFAFADGTTLDPSIQTGFTNAGETIGLIVAAGVTASVGVIALAAGAKVGLKWIKSTFSKAS